MSIIHQFILGGHGRKNGRRRPGAVPIQTTVEKQISQKNTVHNMMALFIFMLFMVLNFNTNETATRFHYKYKSSAARTPLIPSKHNTESTILKFSFSFRLVFF